MTRSSALIGHLARGAAHQLRGLALAHRQLLGRDGDTGRGARAAPHQHAGPQLLLLAARARGGADVDPLVPGGDPGQAQHPRLLLRPGRQAPAPRPAPLQPPVPGVLRGAGEGDRAPSLGHHLLRGEAHPGPGLRHAQDGLGLAGARAVGGAAHVAALVLAPRRRDDEGIAADADSSPQLTAPGPAPAEGGGGPPLRLAHEGDGLARPRLSVLRADHDPGGGAGGGVHCQLRAVGHHELARRGRADVGAGVCGLHL